MLLFEQLLAQYKIQRDKTNRLLYSVNRCVVRQVVNRNVSDLRKLIQLSDLRELLEQNAYNIRLLVCKLLQANAQQFLMRVVPVTLRYLRAEEYQLIRLLNRTVALQ